MLRRLHLGTLQGRLGDAQNLADSASDDIRAGKTRENVASITRQIEHLREVFARRQAEHAQAQQTVNQVELWVGKLNPETTRLEMAKGANSTLLEGETVSQALDRIRTAISEVELELNQTRYSPPPRQELRELAAEHVIARANKGRPRLAWRERDGLVIDFAHPQAWGTGLDEMLNFACWLDMKTMAERLFEEIDSQLKTEGGLSWEEREQAISRLTAELDRLSREEESLVEQAGVPRLDVREPTSNPGRADCVKAAGGGCGLKG